MTKIKIQALTEKLGFWKDTLINKLHKENQNSEAVYQEGKNKRDMSNHTPVSRDDATVHFDLTGLTREQAKAEIERLVDEKLERLSKLELEERKIDYREKERQRALAAERISERRNRRKECSGKIPEPIITEEGIFAVFKESSVFDEIQPESFPYEKEQLEPIFGQITMMEIMEPEASEAEATETKISAVPENVKEPENFNMEVAPEIGIDSAAKTETKTEQEQAPTEKKLVKKRTSFSEWAANLAAKVNLILKRAKQSSQTENQPSYAIDSAIDRVFVFFDKIKRRCQKTYRKGADLFNSKVLPKINTAIIKIEKKYHLKEKSRAVAAVLCEKENVTSDKAAGFIRFLDIKIEQLLRKIAHLIIWTVTKFDQTVDYIEHNRKKLLIEVSAGVAVIAFVMLMIGSMTAYEYIYNGKVLGIVKNQEDVYKTIDIIGNKLSYEYKAEITIDKEKDITFHKVYAWSNELDNKEDILNRLTYMRDMKANGHGIYVDGKLVAILDSKKSANEVLKAIQSRYLKKDAGIKYESVGFSEKVKIKDVETKLGNIQKKDAALEFMLTGATEKKIHVVQSGETFSEIAKMYGLKQSELRNSNPDVIPEKLKISQEICLTQMVPVVTVQTKEVATYQQVIPFEISYEKTNSLYKNEQTVKSKGRNGEKEVVAQIVRNNGIEIGRTELSSKILSQPASQVVLVGTKEPPPLIGTGTFIYPIRGTLTSRYGSRWGRLHSGIDLAAPIGTKISAADGGKVVFAGYNGSLGKCIKINHGGNRVTVYGHCSKLFVKTGDRVFQGQHIANVGNTGRSTGPHVHFEVHINGRAKNPLNYL